MDQRTFFFPQKKKSFTEERHLGLKRHELKSFLSEILYGEEEEFALSKQH